MRNKGKSLRMMQDLCWFLDSGQTCAVVTHIPENLIKSFKDILGKELVLTPIKDSENTYFASYEIK